MEVDTVQFQSCFNEEPIADGFWKGIKVREGTLSQMLPNSL